MTQFDPATAGEKKESKNQSIKFGKKGDWFKGVLTDMSRQLESTYNPGEMHTIVELKAIGGSFHETSKNEEGEIVVAAKPTEPEAGDFYSFITGKESILRTLKKEAKLGQEVSLHFAEVKKAKNPAHNPAKIIEVYVGKMDPEYKGEDSESSFKGQ